MKFRQDTNIEQKERHLDTADKALLDQAKTGYRTARLGTTIGLSFTLACATGGLSLIAQAPSTIGNIVKTINETRGYDRMGNGLQTGFDIEEINAIEPMGNKRNPVVSSTLEGVKRSTWRTFTTPVAHLTIAGGAAIDIVNSVRKDGAKAIKDAFSGKDNHDLYEEKQSFPVMNKMRYIAYKFEAISPSKAELRNIQENMSKKKSNFDAGLSI